MKPRIAVYPGSFDPLTLGHINIIERSSVIFDKLIVVIASSSEKKYIFDSAERAKMLSHSTSHLQNVKIAVCKDRYVVDVALLLGAEILIRGLRNAKDFSDEQTLAIENRNICPAIETLWIPCLPELTHVSSSLVKGHIGVAPGWEKHVARLVTPFVLKKIQEKHAKQA